MHLDNPYYYPTSVHKTKEFMPQLSDDRLKNEFDDEQKGQSTKKHHSPSDEETKEAKRVKKQKDNEKEREKEKVERERAKNQNIIADQFKRLLEQERIQKQKEQQERNQKDKERDMKNVGGWAKVSNDQAKSFRSDLVEVQFKWVERAQKVCIEVRLFFGGEVLS